MKEKLAKFGKWALKVVLGKVAEKILEKTR